MSNIAEDSTFLRNFYRLPRIRVGYGHDQTSENSSIFFNHSTAVVSTREPRDSNVDLVISRVINRLNTYVDVAKKARNRTRARVRAQEPASTPPPLLPGFEHIRVKPISAQYANGRAVYRDRLMIPGPPNIWPYDGRGLYEHSLPPGRTQHALLTKGVKNTPGKTFVKRLSKIFGRFRTSGTSSSRRMPNSAIPHPIWTLPYRSDQDSLASDDDDGDLEVFLHFVHDQAKKSNRRADKVDRGVYLRPTVMYNKVGIIGLDNERPTDDDVRHGVSMWLRDQEARSHKDQQAPLRSLPIAYPQNIISHSRLLSQLEASHHTSIEEQHPHELVSIIPSMSFDTCDPAPVALADLNANVEPNNTGPFGYGKALTAQFFPSAVTPEFSGSQHSRPVTTNADSTVSHARTEVANSHLEHALASSDEEGSEGWMSRAVSPITPHQNALDSFAGQVVLSLPLVNPADPFPI
ncbi:hypothetical protein FRB98_002902 [Tulasnella sp. 332]|nr:hypothetical protein FRB98_002902 [Tulasnella sp. 332]